MTQTSARAGDTRRSPLARSATLGAGLAAALAMSAQAADIHGISAMAGPPAGFDAVHASDAQLNAFALPPRPDATKTPDAYAKWVRAMSARTRRVMAPLQITNVYHGPVRAPAAAGRIADTSTYTSYNWSGVVNTNTLSRYNANHSFYYLVSDFVIPTATNATCDGTWDYSSTWDGIDGWNSGDVLQAGTESDAYCSGGSTNTYYSAWIEWYPYSESRISGFPVAPGDDMFVEVWDVSSTVGYAYLENISTGQTAEYELTAPSGTQLVGNSAEWIVERPSVGGSLATLSAYGLDYQSGAAAYNFNFTQYVPGSSTSFLVNMLDNNGDTISAPSLLGKTAIEYVYE
jgi:hypothetical protein